MNGQRILILGGGFAGLNAAKVFGRDRNHAVTLVDRSNHHLFQPLLYQVAMAALSPADIAAPIRVVLNRYRNVQVLQGQGLEVDPARQQVRTDFGMLEYDRLLLACGARHAYFGHPEWETHAPGLKTLAQATEIRRRVLQAFEYAERETDPDRRRVLLDFVIVGAGPTGVELAGAIGEMSRHTLARDFRRIDPKQTRVLLLEAGPRVLPSFTERQSERARQDLESLGVTVWTSRRVTGVDAEGVSVEGHRIQAATVLWAAGVEAASIARSLNTERDAQGRIKVLPTLQLPGDPRIYVAGDLAHCIDEHGALLPGVAAVAVQQGRCAARNMLADFTGRTLTPFRYADKGQMATIGRNRAVATLGKLHLEGRIAWWTWLLVHILYLMGFRNRLSVLVEWAWSYLTFGRGARLIVRRDS